MPIVVVALLDWYRSTMFWGIVRMNGGWLLVIRIVVGCLVLDFFISPICVKSRMRALWSPYSGM